MDAERFQRACQVIMGSDKKQNGIGTLGEKTLHAVLKLYFEPDEANHEVPVGRYVADACGSSGFIEIQTRNFYALNRKLEALLNEAPVTVVYPVPALKWVSWIENDGSVSQRRKSPKQAQPCEILFELYKIKDFLGRDGLRFCVVMLEVEDYRLKNGWSSDGKRGSTRFERIPVTLLDELWLNSLEDYKRLIPKSLSETFTVKDFSKAAKLSPSKAASAVNVLFTVGAVERTGKTGNAYIYRRC